MNLQSFPQSNVFYHDVQWKCEQHVHGMQVQLPHQQLIVQLHLYKAPSESTFQNNGQIKDQV